jgi:hypothetical protein
MTLREYKTKPVYTCAKTVTLFDRNGDKLPNQDVDEASLQDMEVVGTALHNCHLSIMLPIGEKKVVNKVHIGYIYKAEVELFKTSGRYVWKLLYRPEDSDTEDFSVCATGVSDGLWDAFNSALLCKCGMEGKNG